MKKALIFCYFVSVSILVIYAQQGNTTDIKGKYFSMSLPNTWQERDGHMLLDQIKTETGLSQSKIDSVLKCYVDSQNYYNVLLIAERILSRKALQGVTIEQLIQRPGEKKVYNGLEFLITTDTNASLTYISANAIYDSAVFWFCFVLDKDDIEIVDQTLSSINFIDIKPEEEERLGFFSGIWHGIRSPFVFIINIFKKDKIVLFSKSRTIGYIIGFILAFPIGLAALSGIFGGSRRRY